MKKLYRRRFLAVLLAVCMISLGGTARLLNALDNSSGEIDGLAITYTNTDMDLENVFIYASEGFQSFRNMFIIPGVEKFVHNCFIGIGSMPGLFK